MARNSQLNDPILLQKRNSQQLQFYSPQNSPLRISTPLRVPKSTIQLKNQISNKSKNEELKVKERIWNERIMESKKLDSKVVYKYQKINNSTIIIAFLILFILLFYLTPAQGYQEQQSGINQ